MTGWLPTRAELVDVLFLCALVLLAMVGFRHVFGGTLYIELAAVGVVLGVLLAQFTSRTHQPVGAVGVLAVLLALLLGGVVLKDTAVAGFLPSLDTVRGLGQVTVRGWKDLLTTVRPVGDTDDLLALPYLLALVAGVAGHSLAQRTRLLAAPILPAAGVVALSILFGTAQPESAFLQGSLFTAVALAWMALRRSRDRISLVRTSRRLFRPAAGLAVLGLATAAAWVVGPALPFADAHKRVVLEVQPPFDPGTYPSPLSAFRRYTKNSTASLVDTPLLRVQGLGADRTVRLATLDAYDGVVWGASNSGSNASPVAGFARVSTQLPPTGTGPTRTVTLTLAEGIAGNVWLPTVGAPQGLRFLGPRQEVLQQDLRYNLATATGIVPSGLQPGDGVELPVRTTPALGPEALLAASPSGSPNVATAAYEPLRAAAADWSATVDTSMAKVVEIGKHLREGAYSDGLDAVPSDPGHGAGRLTTFVQGKQIVGDDEQYASAMALMANAVGVPARVVLFGVAAADGLVTGKDVQAGVELELAGQGWVPFATSLFTPARDKKPQVQPVTELPQVPPKVVPPPLLPILSSGTSSTEADTSAGRRSAGRKGGFALPGPVRAALRWGGPPVLLVGLLVGAILGLKGRRRTRRRTRGPATTRMVNGWYELLDAAHDLGRTAPPCATRREQATVLHPLPVGTLATRADAAVFGPGEPLTSDVDAFWADVDGARRAFVADLPRYRRALTALSLRSLLPHVPARAEQEVS